MPDPHPHPHPHPHPNQVSDDEKPYGAHEAHSGRLASSSSRDEATQPESQASPREQLLSPGGGRFQGGLGRPQRDHPFLPSHPFLPFGRLEEASRLETLGHPELSAAAEMSSTSTARSTSTSTSTSRCDTSTDGCESRRSTVASMVSCSLHGLGESPERGATADGYGSGLGSSLTSRWDEAAATALRNSLHSEIRGRKTLAGSVGSGRRDTRFVHAAAATLDRTKDGKKPRATKLGNQFATASVLTPTLNPSP